MSIATTRANLGAFLNDPTLTLLLLFADTPRQRALAAAADTISATMPWRQAVVVADLGMLAASETTHLAAAADRYAVLGAGDNQARVLTDAGASQDLLLPDGGPSILRLRRAFAKGEQA